VLGPRIRAIRRHERCQYRLHNQRPRRGGEEPATFPDHLSADLLHGELAESWEWKQNPLHIEIKLRNGVMFPDKPGIMKGRELVAADVAYAFLPLNEAAKRNAKHRDHIENIEATDPHTGKLDVLEGISWQNANDLRKSAPQLQWRR
jgi:ABC-type transport system substrate-binding protein